MSRQSQPSVGPQCGSTPWSGHSLYTQVRRAGSGLASMFGHILLWGLLTDILSGQGRTIHYKHLTLPVVTLAMERQEGPVSGLISVSISNRKQLESSAPLRGLLSSNLRLQQKGPLGQEVTFADKRTSAQTNRQTDCRREHCNLLENILLSVWQCRVTQWLTTDHRTALLVV